MDTNALAAVKVNDLTKTRSAGRPVNSHVIRWSSGPSPDYEKMRLAVHAEPKAPGTLKDRA